MGVSLDDKSLDLSECIFWKKIFLANLTFAVYISSSGCTLTFRPKSEVSLACSPLSEREEDEDKTITIATDGVAIHYQHCPGKRGPLRRCGGRPDGQHTRLRDPKGHG